MRTGGRLSLGFVTCVGHFLRDLSSTGKRHMRAQAVGLLSRFQSHPQNKLLLRDVALMDVGGYFGYGSVVYDDLLGLALH